MVDLLVYTNHRMGVCIITHPFLTMFYPLLRFWFSFEAVYFPRSRCSRLGIGEIDHIPIAHVYGFGYIELKVNRDTVMPDEKSKEMFPTYNLESHTPSFIDLLEYLSSKYNFNIGNIVKNI